MAINWKQQNFDGSPLENDQTAFSNWMTSLFQDEGLSFLDESGSQSDMSEQPASGASDWLSALAQDEGWSQESRPVHDFSPTGLGQETETPSQTTDHGMFKANDMASDNLYTAPAALFRFDSDREIFGLEENASAKAPDLSQKDYIELAFESFGRGGSKGKPPKNEDPPPPEEDPVDPPEISFDYDIDINFIGSLWTDKLMAAFTESASFIESYIYGDLQDIIYEEVTYDDIVIDAELIDIDGAGGILGRAGPTLIRSAGYLPIKAIMEFDVADAFAYDSVGLFDDIVFHEMMHSIGFGSLWDRQYLNLIGRRGDFKGDAAKLANGDVKPKVELDGGPGTARSHWDESAYGTEIMTGYINGANYLDPMTMAALQDMGYDTIFDPSNPEALPTTELFV